MQYYFILGKNPILSKAEIEAVLEIFEFRILNSEIFGNVLILETKQALDVEQLNNRLGGTVKIGKIVNKIESLDKFEDHFCSLVTCQAGKLHFGFSIYDLDSGRNFKKIQPQLKFVAMEIKRQLREEKNLNSRWVTSKEPELSSVIVKKNQLLKYGSEICLFFTEKNILVGQTLAVQQFEEFGARDYNRPGRDDLSGMLPPKLARMMINLAQVKESAAILDPFCGSGTILQEALVLGYNNLIGSDNSDKAVEDTKRNLEWLTKKFPISNFQFPINKVEVEDLGTKIKPNSIDAIITEPYLGPALKGNESPDQIDKIVNELKKLYLTAFEQFAKVLKKKGKVVIVFPIFKKYDKELLIQDKLVKLGFKEVNQEKLIYSREKQHVWREIRLFSKVV